MLKDDMELVKEIAREVAREEIRKAAEAVKPAPVVSPDPAFGDGELKSTPEKDNI